MSVNFLGYSSLKRERLEMFDFILNQILVTEKRVG